MIAVLTIAVGLLVAAGVYLLLSRRLFSAILGLSLLAHAANLVMVAAGGVSDNAPLIVDGIDSNALGDPVPQAFVLTAIVISMAVTLYQLAILARSGQRSGGTRIPPLPSDDSGRAHDEVRRELGGGEEEGA